MIWPDVNTDLGAGKLTEHNVQYGIHFKKVSIKAFGQLL